MIILLFYTALFALIAWVAWTYITIQWAKYLVGGIFFLLALFELLSFALDVIGGGSAPLWHHW